MTNQVEELAQNRCQSLVGPAGYGKSDSIAQALKITDGRQLILTHTHAGVRSLRNKFNKYKVPQSKYVLETIHGFFLTYAASYPSNSGIDLSAQKNDLWDEIIPAFDRLLLETKVIKQILRCSYKGVFVDEYQDCTRSQHNAIMKICEILPVRVLGDPLQGIFDFNTSDPMVDWERDVSPYFTELDELRIPWRWKGNNEVLGDWLKELRGNLLSEKKINLLEKRGALVWRPSPTDYLQTVKLTANCISTVPKGQTLVAIQQMPNQAHAFARSHGGRLQSMEEMACSELFDSLSTFENASENVLVRAVIEFIKKCTIMNNYLDDVIKQSKRTKLKFDFTKINNPEIRGYIFSIFHNHDYSAIADLIEYTLQKKGKGVFRKELMIEMSKSLKEYCAGGYTSLEDAAWEVRTRTRIRGQALPDKVVSRPHLVKGLEFDNALVMNADNIKNAKYFYVCLTRACNSMTVLSENPIVHFKLT